MVITEKTTINELKPAENMTNKATPKASRGAKRVTPDQPTSASKKKKIKTPVENDGGEGSLPTRTIINPNSIFDGAEMEATSYGKNQVMYAFVLTQTLMEGDKTRHAALKTPRTATGLPINPKLRSKEAALAAGTLICAKCKVRPGDPIGKKNKIHFNVFSYDLDGLTDKHLKDGSKASKRVGQAELEIANGDAQWLCKFCHAVKSSGHEYLFGE
ncbi:hypothetical protein TrCOL_g9406 [Triparma columacea]|uniref:Uncharacterized protein n=1 Tax=Triparma columacea TaxID=722753 RepID=A0A9W7LG90_9STRA|nr:hypothetical protein TrCOL_g9406 [Triparma columacea]